jgi:galactose mutarotase-like enzyme
VFTARTAERTIAVEFGDGYRYAQVFSPPGAEFVCFEPMTSPSNALIAADLLTILPAGEHTRATFKIKVT